VYRVKELCIQLCSAHSTGEIVKCYFAFMLTSRPDVKGFLEALSKTTYFEYLILILQKLR
jgi:hypothetical protein